MDTRQIKYFVALAETLHFGRAAARMNMSQPPFSRQIAAIETVLGVKLFERNSRNVALTTAGKHFLIESHEILLRLESACRDVKLVAHGMKGELRLGFMMHAANSVLPSLVRSFSEARPEVKLVLEERIPTEIDEMLSGGKLDAAITFGVTDSLRLRGMLLARDQLCLIAPVDHPLSLEEVIGPKALDGQKLITAPASVAPTLRSAINSYCALGQIVPNFAYEPRLQHTIIQLVAEGLGVALIPKSLTGEVKTGIVTRPLRDAPDFDVTLYAPIASKNPAVQALFDVAATYYRPSALGGYC